MTTVATTEELVRVLTRRPIPPGQITLYKVLYEAGDKWVSKYELACQIRGGDEVSLRGVLRALGERVNYTEELKGEDLGIGLFFEIAKYHGEWHYRMRQEVRASIEALPTLCAAMKLSVEEICQLYEVDWLEAAV